MSPPQLTADAPVPDIVRPVEIDLFHALGNQPDLALFHRLHRRLNQLVHLHEPLLLHKGFHGGLAAVMGAYIMRIILDLHQQSKLLQLFHDGLSGLISIHALKSSAVGVDGGVIVHHIDDGKPMPSAHLKIVGVMGRGDLHHARAELPVHISVRNNRNHTVHDRQHHAPADEMAVPLILRMDCHRRISQHGLRPGGGESQKLRIRGSTVLPHNRVLDMPQMSRLLLINHLRIGNRSVAHRAPVDDP